MNPLDGWDDQGDGAWIEDVLHDDDAPPPASALDIDTVFEILEAPDLNVEADLNALRSYKGYQANVVLLAKWEVASIPGYGYAKVWFFVLNHEQHAYEVKTEEIDRQLSGVDKKIRELEREMSDARDERNECRRTIRERKRDMRDQKKNTEQVAEEFEVTVKKLEAEIAEIAGEPASLLHQATKASYSADETIASTVRSLALFITHPDFKSDHAELERAQDALDSAVEWVSSLEARAEKLAGLEGVNWSAVKPSAGEAKAAAEQVLF